MDEPITAVILCAGEAIRYGGDMKQLLEVDGRPLIMRMLSQLKDRGVPTWLVTHKAKAYQEAGIEATYFEPAGRRWTIETLASTRELWGVDQTIILLGDVYYSDACVDLLINGETLFYCGYEEIWGLSIMSRRYKKVERILTQTLAKAMLQSGGIQHHQGQIWRFYRVWYGLPYIGDWKVTDGLLFEKAGTTIVVMDETADFDEPQEYEAWQHGLRGWQVKFPEQQSPCQGLARVHWVGKGDTWRCPYDGRERSGFRICKHEECTNRHPITAKATTREG